MALRSGWAVAAKVTLAFSLLASACALDDRTFSDTTVSPPVAGSPGLLDPSARRQSDPGEGVSPDLDRSETANPVSGIGSSICAEPGNCGCDAGAASCEPPPSCADGGCEGSPCPGCLIVGECLGPETINAENPCQICDPARDSRGWTDDDGADCDDGLFCTTADACNGGRCAGAALECDDGVACNGLATCDEESDSCAPGENQCTGGTVCSVAAGACVNNCSGCLIAGSCLQTGAEESGNPCRVCDPARSVDSFSAAVGKPCGASASDCSQQDTCNAQGACQANDLSAGTACGDSSSTDCDQSDACDGRGFCQARRAANGTVCSDGQFCTATDRCQGGVCGGSGATCIVNQTCNESTNQCVCSGGGTLSCASPLGGNPNCSSWDFESNGAEGWEFDLASAGASDAHVGQLASSTAVRAPRGNRSLAVRFEGTGNPGRTTIFIRTPLCAGGSAVDISFRRLQALVRLVTDPGTNALTTGQGHLVSLYTGEQFPFAGGDFSVDPATGGGTGPLGWRVVDVDITEQFGDRAANAIYLGFRLLVDSVWRGTIYIDDVRLI